MNVTSEATGNEGGDGYKERVVGYLEEGGEFSEAEMVRRSELEVIALPDVGGLVGVACVAMWCPRKDLEQLRLPEEGGTNPLARLRIYQAIRSCLPPRYRHVSFELRAGLNGHAVRAGADNGKAETLKAEPLKSTGSGKPTPTSVASGHPPPTGVASGEPASTIESGKVSGGSPVPPMPKAVAAPVVAAEVWQRLGGLEYTAGFSKVRFSFEGRVYELDLRGRLKLRLLLELVVQREAYSADKALDFLSEIEAYVLKAGNFPASFAPKLAHYFNSREGHLAKLQRRFFRLGRAKGSYYFDREA